MTNPPRVKGTRAESAAAKWLSDELGVVVTRGPLRGNADRGDLFGIPDTCVEVKNCKTPDPKGWERELWAEMDNAECSRGVILWSPPGVGMTNVDKWIALSPHPITTWHVAPHIGTLGTLHKYVSEMAEWQLVVFVNTLYATAASCWLYEVRERMATA